MKSNSFDVAICGAGLNGSLMALSLVKVGFSVAIIDPLSSSACAVRKFDGRAYSIISSSKIMLEKLNIWSDLEGLEQAISTVKISSSSSERRAFPFYVHFDGDSISEPMGYIIEDRHLRKGIENHLSKSSQIEFFFSKKVLEIKDVPGSKKIIMSDKNSIEARLVIGADGRNSFVAKCAKIKRVLHDYGQKSIVCAVEHQFDHFGEAHQIFRPSGPLAILPLTGKRSSLVWTEETRVADKLLGLDESSFRIELQQRLGDYRGHIALIGERIGFPLVLSIADRLVDQRLALIGEAGHSVHPIAGQGLNLGFRDIACLVEILIEARSRGEDIGNLQVLERYSAWRNLDRLSVILATDRVNKLFSNEDLFKSLIRNLGMGVINRLPQIKRLLVNEASGHLGTLPKLMKDKEN